MHCENDIITEYIANLFPNLETLEMFGRATRRVPMDTIKVLASQTGLKVSEFNLMLELNKVKSM